MTENDKTRPNFGETLITLDGQETELSRTNAAESMTSEQIADHYDANGPVVWESALRRVMAPQGRPMPVGRAILGILMAVWITVDGNEQTT